MAPSKLFSVAFVLSTSSPCPVASFSRAMRPGHARSFSFLIAAYINPDGGGSNLGGREFLRNNTMREIASLKTVISAEIDDKDRDIVGPGTLGDIMAGSSDSVGRNNNANANLSQTEVVDGLVTKDGGELNAKFGCRFSPMERIALTANGNLQRIFSSYYDAPVHVHVDSCARREGVFEENTSPQSLIGSSGLDRFEFRVDANDAVWDRVVHLYVHKTTLCKATSIIHVRSAECINLIEDGSVGLGQLFRFLNKLPTFKLLDAGRTQESEQLSASFDSQGGMWRIYELQCEEMTCLIHEKFHRDAWNIFPAGSGDAPFEPLL